MPSFDSAVRTAQSRIAGMQHGVNSGKRAADDPELLAAKAAQATAKIAHFIERTLDGAPPLSADQQAKLVDLLRPAREHLSQAATNGAAE